MSQRPYPNLGRRALQLSRIAGRLCPSLAKWGSGSTQRAAGRIEGGGDFRLVGPDTAAEFFFDALFSMRLLIGCAPIRRPA